MNSEMQAVSYINLAISKTDYLIPHINANDREPSWDGDVEVYRKAGDTHAKADLIIKVPVQIKGHKATNLNKQTITYPVEYSDMENFLTLGGTVFIVVYVDEEGEHHKIYYTEFLPFGLKRLIRKHKGKTTQTKNITMKEMPTSKTEISDLFLGFARNMKKQRSTIYSEELSLEEIVKKGNVPELSFGFSHVPQKDLTPFDLMLRGNLYLYAKMPHGVELTVEHIETIEMTGTNIDAPVTANGKLFYMQYAVVYKKDVIELKFGKSTTHTINRTEHNKQNFTFTLSGTLQERIRDEEFIIEALTAGQFEVGGTVCPLNEATPDELASFDIPRRIEHLEWLRTVKKTLDALDIREDLDCSELSKKDEGNLHLLKSAVIDGETVKLTGADSVFGFFNIANLHILVCVVKKDDGYNIYSYNDTPLDIKVTSENGHTYSSSCYVLLKKEAILKASNINYSKMMDNIKSVEPSAQYFDQLTMLLLEFLKAYDKSNPRQNNILDAATDLAEWLLSNDTYTPREILLLNYYQTIRRQRTLTRNEINDLLELVESATISEDIYTGAYLLLDDETAANIHYARISEDEQMYFLEYPICAFWKAPPDNIPKITHTDNENVGQG